MYATLNLSPDFPPKNHPGSQWLPEMAIFSLILLIMSAFTPRTVRVRPCVRRVEGGGRYRPPTLTLAAPANGSADWRPATMPTVRHDYLFLSLIYTCHFMLLLFFIVAQALASATTRPALLAGYYVSPMSCASTAPVIWASAC